MAGFYLFLLAAASADGDGLQDVLGLQDASTTETLDQQIAAMEGRTHSKLEALHAKMTKSFAAGLPTSFAEVSTDKIQGLPPMHLDLNERKDAEMYGAIQYQDLLGQLGKIDAKEDKTVSKMVQGDKATEKELDTEIHDFRGSAPPSTWEKFTAPSSLLQETPSVSAMLKEDDRLKGIEDTTRAELDQLTTQTAAITENTRKQQATDAGLRASLMPDADSSLLELPADKGKHQPIENMMTGDDLKKFDDWADAQKDRVAAEEGTLDTLQKGIANHQGWPVPMRNLEAELEDSEAVGPSSFMQESSEGYVPQSPAQSAFQIDQAVQHMKSALMQVKKDSIESIRKLAGKDRASFEGASSLLQSSEGKPSKIEADLHAMHANLEEKLKTIHSNYEKRMESIDELRHPKNAIAKFEPESLIQTGEPESLIQTGAAAAAAAEGFRTVKTAQWSSVPGSSITGIDAAYASITAKLNKILAQHKPGSSLLQESELPGANPDSVKDQEAKISSAFDDLDKQMDVIAAGAKKGLADTKAMINGPQGAPESILEEGYHHHQNAHRPRHAKKHAHHSHDRAELPEHGRAHRYGDVRLPESQAVYGRGDAPAHLDPREYEEPTAAEWAKRASHHHRIKSGRLQASMVHENSYAKELAGKVAQAAEDEVGSKVMSIKDLVHSSYDSLKEDIRKANEATMADFSKIAHPDLEIHWKKREAEKKKMENEAYGVANFAARRAGSLLESEPVLGEVPGEDVMEVNQIFRNLDMKMRQVKDKASSTLEAINQAAGVHIALSPSSLVQQRLARPLPYASPRDLEQPFAAFQQRTRQSLLEDPAALPVVDVKHAFDDLNAKIDAINTRTTERIEKDKAEFPQQPAIDASSFLQVSPLDSDLVLPAGYSFQDLEQRLDAFDAKAAKEAKYADDRLPLDHLPESLLEGQYERPQAVNKERAATDRDLEDVKTDLKEKESDLGSHMDMMKDLELRTKALLNKGTQALHPTASSMTQRVEEARRVADEPELEDEDEDGPQEPRPEAPVSPAREHEDEVDIDDQVPEDEAFRAQKDNDAALQSDLKQAQEKAQADEEKENKGVDDNDRDFAQMESKMKKKEDEVQSKVDAFLVDSRDRRANHLEDQLKEQDPAFQGVGSQGAPVKKGVRPGASLIQSATLDASGAYSSGPYSQAAIDKRAKSEASALEQEFESSYAKGFQSGEQTEQANELTHQGSSASFMEAAAGSYNPASFSEIEGVKKELKALSDSLGPPPRAKAGAAAKPAHGEPHLRDWKGAH